MAFCHQFLIHRSAGRGLCWKLQCPHTPKTPQACGFTFQNRDEFLSIEVESHSPAWFLRFLISVDCSKIIFCFTCMPCFLLFLFPLLNFLGLTQCSLWPLSLVALRSFPGFISGAFLPSSWTPSSWPKNHDRFTSPASSPVCVPRRRCRSLFPGFQPLRPTSPWTSMMGDHAVFCSAVI